MGDDLASDDEYLFDAGLIDASGRGTSILSSDGEDDESSKKRKGSSATTDGQADSATLSSPSKKRKKNKKETPTNSKNVLIHAGRGISLDSVEAQSMFLSTLYSHSIKLSEGTNNNNEPTTSATQGENNDSEEANNNTNSKPSFSFQPHLYSTPSSTDEKTRQFNHTNLASFIKSGPLPSNKRLKNWKHAQSPMILIITLSARRSVELMKQLSTFKLPVCKLFAKHMNLEEQVGLLRGVGGSGGESHSHNHKHKGKKKKCYSLAVGTPSRLLKLLLHGTTNDPNNSDGLGGALRLNHTELVIIDCHEDSKGWNVCTLRDTSSDLIEFLKMGVVPQCEARKGKIKLAMF